jgi:tripartite-type tricarboxylate transporter receptor subunit TctC
MNTIGHPGTKWTTGWFGTLLAAGLAMSMAMSTATAQTVANFPSRTVRLITPFPPGGASDLITRALAAGLQNLWGKPVVVENQAGAGGIIAVESVVRSQPDGTTLILVGATPTTVLPFMMDKLTYDPLKDLLPIANTVAIPNILVVASSSPYKSFKDLINAAKAKPGALDYASSGRGQSHHLMMEYMMQATGTKLNEIPYKGGAPALVAVLSGEVQAGWIAVSTALPLIRSGQLRALAVSTQERFSQLPDVPSVAEQGFPGFDFSFWVGIFGSGKTPPALVRKLEADIKTVITQDSFRESIAKQGNLLHYESSEQFARTVRDEYQRNKTILAP